MMVLCFHVAAAHASGLPGVAAARERQLCLAQQAIHEFTTEVEAARNAFTQPENLADPQWVAAALAHMARVDALARNALITPVVERRWDPAVTGAYIQYFINPKYRPNAPNGEADDTAAGFLQTLDKEHAQLLRRLLEESPALEPHGWPVVSVHGAAADHHAWLILQRARAVDRSWVEGEVAPRLKALSADGEHNPVGVQLMQIATPQALSDMVSHLRDAGPPWEGYAATLEAKRNFLSRLNALNAADVERLPPLKAAPCFQHRDMPRENSWDATRQGGATKRPAP